MNLQYAMEKQFLAAEALARRRRFGDKEIRLPDIKLRNGKDDYNYSDPDNDDEKSDKHYDDDEEDGEEYDEDDEDGEEDDDYSNNKNLNHDKYEKRYPRIK